MPPSRVPAGAPPAPLASGVDWNPPAPVEESPLPRLAARVEESPPAPVAPAPPRFPVNLRVSLSLAKARVRGLTGREPTPAQDPRGDGRYLDALHADLRRQHPSADAAVLAQPLTQMAKEAGLKWPTPLGPLVEPSGGEAGA